MDAIIKKFKHGLQRTKTMFVRQIHSLFTEDTEWNDASYERLEEILIGTDLGVHITGRIIENIRDRYARGLIQTSSDIIESTKAVFVELLEDNSANTLHFSEQGPTVVLMVGVNGSGKTTTTGKLAGHWRAEGKSVILAACDTFRAAAIEQINIWGERTGVPVVSAKYGADAASVAFDAVNAAMARNHEILIIDTAGRQHTKKGLMDELAKIKRTVGKACPGAPHEIWLVVDGSTGTNALQQARIFKDRVGVTGLCLTKLDGSSKGGVVVAIHDELDLPIRFIGLGEGPSDLQPFNIDYFVNALFEN